MNVKIRPLPELSEQDLIRFWKKVSKTEDGCWIWIGTRASGSGYGRFFDIASRQYFPAHRIAYLVGHGVAPLPGELVCHTCDNPPCIRPEHLFLGSHSDNAKDMVKKGRWHGLEYKTGDLHPSAKLSDEVADDIRRLYATGDFSQTKLGAIFKVHQVTISEIILGNRYMNTTKNGAFLLPLGIVEAKKGRPSAKFSLLQVSEIRRLYSDGALQGDLATQFGVTQQTISDIVTHRYYKT